MVWQSFVGFALGFVSWGLSSALMSGTFESMVYDELVQRGDAERYAGLIGWAQSTALGANLTASAGAAWLVHGGGYALGGWASAPVAPAQAPRAGGLPGPDRA